MHIVFECELAAKHITMDDEAETCTNLNPRQYQVTMGRVHITGSTNNKNLSFVKIQYAPVIAPLLNHSQVPVNSC